MDIAAPSPGIRRMTSIAVSAEDVTYAIRGKELIAGVSLVLERGQMNAVIGPNGAGKSTLLRILAGELAPSSGRVCYADVDARLLAPWQLAARRVVMAQATRLAFPFSVWEVVALGIDGLGRRFPRAQRQDVIIAALEKAEVGHLAERIYQTLSGGEQQRVQFARALTQLWAGDAANAAPVLFLDEPTAHLDMSHQWMLMDEVRGLVGNGVSAFVTVHDLNLAAAYADRIIVMSRGRLLAQGAPAEVLSSDLVAKVFGIDSKIGEAAPEGSAFILPHAHAQKSRQAS
jgi:iron complex transport system ATP-binding protein